MNILCDQNIPHARELFGAHGDVSLIDGRQIATEDLTGVDALIVRSVSRVDEALISGTPIRFVGSCTIGTDHLDTHELEAKGIHWCHAPGCNAQSVVEYVSSVLALMDGAKGGKTAAIIGCGRVGSAVYAELNQLGYKVCAYDPFRQASGDDAGGTIRFVSLSEAMASEVVCLHTPLTTAGTHPTAQMIDGALLAQLPFHGLVISAGRGGVIDESALLSMASRRTDVRWVFDVWDGEPEITGDVLALASIATPHIAGYSAEGKGNGTWQVYCAFCEYFSLTAVSRPAPLSPREVALNTPLSRSDFLLGVYDPRDDDARMRSAFENARSERGTPWFDELRRTYPVRRERAGCQFVVDGKPAVLRLPDLAL